MALWHHLQGLQPKHRAPGFSQEKTVAVARSDLRIRPGQRRGKYFTFCNVLGFNFLRMHQAGAGLSNIASSPLWEVPISFSGRTVPSKRTNRRSIRRVGAKKSFRSKRSIRPILPDRSKVGRTSLKRTMWVRFPLWHQSCF